MGLKAPKAEMQVTMQINIDKKTGSLLAVIVLLVGALIYVVGLQHISLLGGSPVARPHGPRVLGAVDTMELFAKEVLPVFA